eukprot:650719-Prymnesium_polylepis.1
MFADVRGKHVRPPSRPTDLLSPQHRSIATHAQADAVVQPHGSVTLVMGAFGTSRQHGAPSAFAPSGCICAAPPVGFFCFAGRT